MKKHRLWLFYISLLSILFSSCEYDGGINYVDVKQPQPIQVGLDLAGLKNEDTIYIYAPTKLYYALNSSGKEVLLQEFKLGDQSLYGPGYITIDPESFDGTTRTLNVNIYIKTGSGSVAEKLGAEAYVGNFKYYLKYVSNPNLSINLRQQKTDDGYFQLIWDDLKIRDISVNRYEITYFDKILDKDVVTNVSPTAAATGSYIDKSYVYGSRTYKVVTYFNNNRIEPIISYYTAQYTEITPEDIVFDISDLQKIKVSWKKNNFKCKYIYKPEIYSDKIYEIPYDKSNVIFDSPGFPYSFMQSVLFIVPEDYTSTSTSLPHLENIYHWYKSPEVDIDVSLLGYNLTKKEFYSFSSYDRSLNTYSTTSFQKINSKSLPNTQHLYGLSASTALSKLIINNSERIDVLNDKLETLSQFDISNLDFGQSHLTLGDNGHLIGARTYSDNRYASVANVADGKLKYKVPLVEYNSLVAISPNGKYICDYLTSRIDIHKLEDSKYTPIYHSNDLFVLYCKFNESKPDELILGFDNAFRTMDMNTMTMSSDIEGTFVCVDPYTGNMACLDKDYNKNSLLNIINPETKKIVCSIKISYYNNQIALINNYLVIYKSYIDLSKHIK